MLMALPAAVTQSRFPLIGFAQLAVIWVRRAGNADGIDIRKWDLNRLSRMAMKTVRKNLRVLDIGRVVADY